MSFLRPLHPPALAARLSETHERLFFLARTERSSPCRDAEDEVPREAADDEEDRRG